MLTFVTSDSTTAPPGRGGNAITIFEPTRLRMVIAGPHPGISPAIELVCIRREDRLGPVRPGGNRGIAPAVA